MYITETVKYIGVNDRDIDLFEGLYVVPEGMAYNSYVILDEKVAVFDTVDSRFVDMWLENLEAALEGRTPDYLIVQHMEPDHSAGIAVFAEKYPEAVIVSSMPAFTMMNNYFGKDFAQRRMAVKDGETLSLGGRDLLFVAAPMVHWPEVTMTYDKGEKILFSADAFGKFGALDGNEDWACEARRYYFGIVGRFGQQVQNLLQKAAALEIAKICPLHGPVLTENLEYYLDLYKTWSSYGVESDGVMVAYTSVYGHTKKAAEKLAKMLEERGQKVVLSDLARSDWAENVEDAFRYGKLVLATTTYNAGIFPVMQEFIEHLVERNYQKRTVALVENGTWAPMAGKKMTEKMAGLKDITWLDGVKIVGELNAASEAQLVALADALCK